ncbi:hypothetical protein ILUMI_06621 [Ignelater luminosus]|uniref:Cytochrome P450 n=1 Tax=Ignelater luminosus TaxID=2038154 RepID=A0A8K0GF62_IGNLU|nr:hypothetical protein ILUMI_06621 [Ignelater luminosus]
MGKDAASFSGYRAFKFIGFAICPQLMKLLDIGIFSKKLQNFFRNTIKETIKIREEKQIVRPDMIHLLLEARKGRLKYEDSMDNMDAGFAVVEESELGKTQKKQKVVITDEDIAALAAGFFLAGFDTVSSAISFLAYELAINPDVQNKLFDEISKAPKDSNGKIKYETLLGMKYLDMVVSESLRKWPPAFITDRISVKSFTIEPESDNENPLYLEKGSQLWIPVLALQRDPKYYPNPDKFDPERFSDENKSNIKPFTYLPFGAGPRNCIGSRFALLENKLLITEILRKFEIISTEKTLIPLESSKTIFNILPDNGVWVALKRRSDYC